MAKIRYNKKYHSRKNPDTVFPGVTTVIKANLGWGNQALMGWVAKVTKEGKDFRATSDDAADAGTLAHALVESFIKKKILDKSIIDSYSESQVKAAHNAFNAFKEWMENSRLRIVESEVEVINEKFLYGGTIDLILQDDDDRFHIADIKTTNFLLPDHLIQVAAYADAFEEEHDRDHDVYGGHLLRFNKGDAVAFHHTFWNSEALADGFEAFVNLRALHNLKKRIEDLC